MMSSHKNKTLATLLAAIGGSTGVHRFYLYGKRDFWAWIYAGGLFLYLCLALAATLEESRWLSLLIVFPVVVYAGFVEALVLGLMPDEQWDKTHNSRTHRRSSSGWRLAVVLVLTLACGFVALVAGLARVTDLYLTGGSFG